MDQVSAAPVLFLLSCFLGTVSGLLSNDFSECKEFFYHGSPPQGITGQEYQPICQKFKEKCRFATLYHLNHRLALYSAYKVSLLKKTVEEEWMFEPQLNGEGNDTEMQPLKKSDTFDNQASLQDYDGSLYTKGHLAPKQHRGTTEDKQATYTLTNIVPQREGSNAGTWNNLEEEISKRKGSCTGEMYVITGTIPFESNSEAPSNIKKMNNKVYAPEYMWSAYCCTNFKEMEGDVFPTYAAVGRNYPDSTDDIVPKNPNVKGTSGYDVKKMSLNDLEAILSKKLNIQSSSEKITLFYNDCKAN
ncbi:hypothetical protein XENORESO_000420 [Xenotaenia resolanae]|uniref:Endonuclease domain-containing 1 protein n=1 Tax=Xenotaenia resolanae TaxID=208358 RepID=A0ABV0WBQ7_9TELE